MATFDLDAQAASHVRKDLLAREPDLAKKWFDYRMLHPVTATALFASAYSDAFSDASALRYDFEEGAKFLGLKRNNSLFDHPKATLTGLWKARQHADERAMPYPIYCGICMSIATTCGWDYLPRPTQLYNEELLVRIDERWLDWKRVDPPYAAHETFSPEAYEALPEQVAYFDYLEELVRGRHHPEYMLESLFHHGRLTPALAAARFPADLIDRALRLRSFI